MRRTTQLIILLLAFVILAGCGPRGGAKERSLQSVAYETARLATVTRTINLVGTVEGERQANAVAKLAGRVTEIARAEGSRVSADDPIVYVVNDIPGMDYKPGPVRAPIAGVVGRVFVEVGQTVAPGVPVATIASYSSRVRVSASISDQDLRFVRPGASGDISVAAWPDTVFTGRVTKVTPVLDQASRTATVELTVDNPGGMLIPGMACGVRLVLEQRENAVALPLTALFTNGFTNVAVLDGNTARFRDIVTGLVGDELVEVLSGIEPGEKVITTGKERVEDGNEVRPVGTGGQ